MKVLQINSVCGIGSTGRIATDIHNILIEQGHESYIAYGRDLPKNCDDAIRIGTKIDNYTHVAKTRLLDKHGFGSKRATIEFIDKVKKLNPDIIHLHNIHGYYINIEILFDYIKEAKKPVVWTLHDCWSFTGHCSHFDYLGCNKWKTGCFDCPQKNEYPKSLILDKSDWNYSKKKENAALNYQLEYILKGIDNDVSNLEKIAEQIFKIRYVINMTYLFSDSAKQAEAEELAIIVTSGIMHPELCEAVKLSILFAWGYAESAKDLRILFDGNKLTDTKTASTWNTPLSQMVTFKEHLGEYSLSGNGRTYKEYLYGFLMLKDKDTINKRLMDIMEMDIRRTDGNQNFKMDQCIYQLQAQINVSSKYGYGYQINRSYSYE